MIPKELGFRMPAEWEKRQRTFMHWPIRKSIWGLAFEKAKLAYAKVATTISEFEEVIMIVDESCIAEAKEMCGSRVTCLSMAHNDSWIRDNGPTFILNNKSQLMGINWVFNAWGGKYTPYAEDNQVAKKILDYYDIPIVNAPMVLEGGAIHVDGEGTLLTTEECLLHPNRNPGMTKIEIEKVLMDYLGVSKIIWLPRGLYGDETDGHIDNIACFVKPGTVAIQVCYDKSDPNYEITMENLKILKKARDANNRQLSIIEIPQPPVRYAGAKRLTLSYINYYPVKEGIILPVFNGEATASDEKAIQILQDVYGDKRVIPVDGSVIIKGGGNVHCITQQMPYGTSTLIKLY